MFFEKLTIKVLSMLSSGSRSLFADFCPEHEFSRVGPASNEAAATAPVFKKSLLSDIVLAIIELKHDLGTNIDNICTIFIIFVLNPLK